MNGSFPFVSIVSFQILYLKIIMNCSCLVYTVSQGISLSKFTNYWFITKTSVFFLIFRYIYIYKTCTHHLSLDIQQILHQIILWYCQCCIFVIVHQPILRTNFNPENIFIIPSAAKLSTPTWSAWYKSNTCSTDLLCVIKKKNWWTISYTFL